MNSKNKNNQNVLQWVIPTVILVVVILFTLTSYKTEILNNEREEKIDEYSSKAREMADYYASEVYTIGQVARMMSTRVSSEFNYFCDDNVDLLSASLTQLKLDSAYLLRNDGTVMNYKGVEADSLADATGDVNLKDEGIDSQYIITGEGDCVHYVSASFAEGKVILRCAPKKIDELELFLSSNSKISTYMLVSSTGIVIDSAGVEERIFKEGTDILEYFEGAEYKESKESTFISDLEQQKKGKALITNKEGVSKYVIYQPVGDYRTFVMIIIDEDQIEQMAEKGISSTTEMFWKIVILVLFFVGILIVISLFSATKYRKANRELREQAETDLLTDLYNKVATETKIKEYLANEGKNKKSIMFVLDIDNFKKINDTMGHAFGDEVLSTLGHQLKSEFRINDIIGRTGGDEFIILLKDLKDDAALMREAERVATFFKNFKVGEYTKYSATASIGAVEIPQDGTEFEVLYKEADKALYRAKKRGKNQMAFYRDTKDDKEEPAVPVLKVVEEPVRQVIEPKTESVVASIKNEPKKESIIPSIELEPKTEKVSVDDKPVTEDIKSDAEMAAVDVKVEEIPKKKKVVKKVVKKVPKKKTSAEISVDADEASIIEKAEMTKNTIDSNKKVTNEVEVQESPAAIIADMEDTSDVEKPKKKVVKKVVKKKVVKKVPKKPEEADSSLELSGDSNDSQEKKDSTGYEELSENFGYLDIPEEPKEPDLKLNDQASIFSFMMDQK